MGSLQVVMDPPPIPAPVAVQSAAELERMFEAHRKVVLRSAYRITGSAADAEDVLQTVFLRLLGRQSDSGAMENVAGYLHRAAVNAALDLVRGRQEGKTVPLEAHEPHLAQEPEQAPDRQQQTREMRDLIRKAIALLPHRAGEIFALHYFEDYSNSDIARMLDLTPSGVGVTLHRVRARLQQQVRNFMGETS
jgi:RNA polymerase sigma-70 factor, ECF subfamily